jgi:hypothetical protein
VAALYPLQCRVTVTGYPPYNAQLLHLHYIAKQCLTTRKLTYVKLPHSVSVSVRDAVAME